MVGDATQIHHDDLVGSFSLSIGLRVESGGEVELHACQEEQLTPEIVGEDRIVIRDDGVGNAMQPNHDVEECLRHSCHRIRMTERGEVCGLQEPVDDGEQDRLAVDTREPLDEVHANARLDHRGQLRGRRRPVSCRCYVLFL
jgi:hypothetical protein